MSSIHATYTYLQMNIYGADLQVLKLQFVQPAFMYEPLFTIDMIMGPHLPYTSGHAQASIACAILC